MPALPSLTAIRSFETAARCGSFSLAARELGVTAAAVSLQVKALESELGRQLFLRQGNRILLTDAGRAIYPRLANAFKELAEAVGPVDQGRGRLVVSVLPMLGSWVAERLADHGDQVEIRLAEDPVSLIKGEADLRVTYGGHLYPDHRVLALGIDRMLPCGLPGCALDGLPPDRFIHMDWGAGYGSLPGWAEWCAAQGMPTPDPGLGWRVNDAGLALVLLRRAAGVALLPERVLGASGLVALGEGLPMPLPNVLVMLQARAASRKLASVAAVLGAVAQPEAYLNPVSLQAETGFSALL
ncbi:MAG: LysR family transcriptional regulator [Tabrizicola sp.]|nr:LysR family transcriptional regulator [Tabrizicola sp.]